MGVLKIRSRNWHLRKRSSNISIRYMSMITGKNSDSSATGTGLSARPIRITKNSSNGSSRNCGEHDLLTQKPYFATACVVHGPVAVDPSETDLSKGGNAEKNEYTLLKFKLEDDYLVAYLCAGNHFWADQPLDQSGNAIRPRGSGR